MKRLIIDMDGVLVDIYGQFIKYEQNDLGIIQLLKNLAGKLEHEAFKNHDTYVNSVGFFESALPITDSVDVVKKLNDIYQVFIVSSAMQFPLSLAEKLRWLNTHFPFLSWKQFVFCGTKELISGHIMIDDHFKNLDGFQGQTILFTQPHNIGKSDGKHKRVSNWQEVAKILL